MTCRLKTVPNNYYRLLRVLEIVMSTGRPRAELNLDTTRYKLSFSRPDLCLKLDSCQRCSMVFIVL